MKTIISLVVLIFSSLISFGQINYFVYMQTDNKQPFYIKMNDKILSSSSAGYVVIPKLSTGTYSLTIGFPKDQWPQQSIPLTVNKEDAGYLLKNFGDKGWGIYNLQSMEVTMNGGKSIAASSTASQNDIFTNTLSGAANTNVATEVIKEDVKKPAAAENPILVNKVDAKNNVLEKSQAKAGSSIKKIKTFKDIDGTSYTYVDNSSSTIDTIPVFIRAANALKNSTASVNIKANAVEKSTQNEKFLDIEMQRPDAKNEEDLNTPVSTVAVSKPAVQPAMQSNGGKPVVSFNSDCKLTAGQNDFLKVRKKMAAASTDEEMVDIAKLVFRNMCFSVEQIKNLSTLFLNDNGKYNFFDAAYPKTVDTQNFAALQTLLTEEYYITRFKAMIRN